MYRILLDLARSGEVRDELSALPAPLREVVADTAERIFIERAARTVSWLKAGDERMAAITAEGVAGDCQPVVDPSAANETLNPQFMSVTQSAYGDLKRHPAGAEMPSSSLIEAFVAAREGHTAAVADLVPLLVDIALATVAEVVPGAEILETEGEMIEEWLFTLRIQRLLTDEDAVLYDATGGHDDPAVEDVGVEYLDRLLESTGDDYLGRKRLRRVTV